MEDKKEKRKDKCLENSDGTVKRPKKAGVFSAPLPEVFYDNEAWTMKYVLIDIIRFLHLDLHLFLRKGYI